MDPDPHSYSYILAIVTGNFTEYGLVGLVIAVLLFLSALMSGAEVAFFSLTKTEIEDFRNSEQKSAGRIIDLVQMPRRLLATILILNNLVNVAIILLATISLHSITDNMAVPLPDWILFVVEVGLITFTLLFFGEITPKVFATQHRLRLVRALSTPLLICRTFLHPVSWLLISLSQTIDKRIAVESEAASVEDIKHAIDLTSEEESPEEEKEILKGIVKFGHISVKSIMTPRVEVKAIEIGVGFEEVIHLVNEYSFSRIPVYEENLDAIKGILYIKDLLPLLKEKSNGNNWQTLIREPLFVPESKKIDDLLDEFKDKRLHIAAVVDEFGGLAGIVTLEDIIEEIFGEINDEFDSDGDELVYSKLSDTEFVFDGRIPLNDLIKVTALPDPTFDDAKGDSDSLAGLVLEIHGKIPERGEIIAYDRFRFHIESVGDNRIKRVKFVMTAGEEEMVE